MAYVLETISADRDWGFSTPQEGEADSTQEVADFRLSVSGAIFDKIEKAKLVSNGGNTNITVGVDKDGDDIVVSTVPTDTTFFVDDYLQQRADDHKEGGMTRYVTSQHYHPTPEWVPNSDHAVTSDSLKGFTIHIDGAADTFIDGKTDVTLPAAAKVHTHVMVDITDMYRIFYGTADPDLASLPSELRDGDLYVKYIN